MSSLTLTRNLTHDKLREYLEHEPILASLALGLGDGVDSNLLIESVRLKDANVKSLQPYFDGCSIGAIGALFVKLRWLIELEASEAKLQLKEKRTELSAEKAAKLKAAMAKEHAGRVSDTGLKDLLDANVAALELNIEAADAKKRAHYEANGTKFTVTVPARNQQGHAKHLMENLEDVLDALSPGPPLVGGKLISKETVLHKGKGKGATAEVRTPIANCGNSGRRHQPIRLAPASLSTPCTRSCARSRRRR